MNRNKGFLFTMVINVSVIKVIMYVQKEAGVRIAFLTKLQFLASSKTRKSHKFFKNLKILKCEYATSKKDNQSKVTSVSKWFSHIANPAAANWVLKFFDPSEYLKLSLFLFMPVLTFKQLKWWSNIHWSVLNQKIKIFRDFWVFIINPIPKNENSEIIEIHQRPKILESEFCNLKNPWNAVQKTLISKWFIHIANHRR